MKQALLVEEFDVMAMPFHYLRRFQGTQGAIHLRAGEFQQAPELASGKRAVEMGRVALARLPQAKMDCLYQETVGRFCTLPDIKCFLINLHLERRSCHRRRQRYPGKPVMCGNVHTGITTKRYYERY